MEIIDLFKKGYEFEGIRVDFLVTYTFQLLLLFFEYTVF